MSYRAAAGVGPGTAVITIDRTQCGSADTANFPLSFRSTLAALKSVANGGEVVNVNGYDIVFYADAAKTVKLDFEVESWNPATGELIAWVRVPLLTVAVNKVIYLGWGDASITTDQSNPTAVWDANFGEVHHFGPNVGTTYSTAVRKDSTANGNTLGNGAGIAKTDVGQIGGSLDVTNTVEILGSAKSASNSPTAAFTIEGWVKPPNYGAWRTLVGKGSSTVRNYHLYIALTTGLATISFTQGASNFKSSQGTTPISTTDFTHLVATYDGANLRIWVNGVNEGTTPVSGAADSPANGMDIGCLTYPDDPLNGWADEVRISDVARSSSYITASYNNQKTGSTFYTVT